MHFLTLPQSFRPKFAKLCATVMMVSLPGCVTYSITPATDNLDKLRGVSYFLPKAELHVTAKWTIFQCDEINKPFLRISLSESVRSVPDYTEHYMVDTSKLSGGFSNDEIGIKVNEEGILESFNVASTGVGTEIVTQAVDLLFPLIGSLVGPSISAAFNVGGTKTLKSTPLCDLSINGNKISELINKRDQLRVSLSGLSEMDALNSKIEVKDVKDKWLPPTTASARRKYLQNRIVAIEDLLSFHVQQSIDLSFGEELVLQISPDFIKATNAIIDTGGALDSIANQSKITISIVAKVPEAEDIAIVKSQKREAFFQKIGKSRSSLVYRIPNEVHLSYKTIINGSEIEISRSRHKSPQAGYYAHIPLSKALFGKTDTKMTFNTITGILESYGLDAETGLDDGLKSFNAAIADISGQDASK